MGKFNAGQKLFAAFAAGALVVMLATGIVLHLFGHFPLSWRAGATFVHNWLAVALVVVVVGHICKALSASIHRVTA
jgi:formate dehydrogenase subunit gamma